MPVALARAWMADAFAECGPLMQLCSRGIDVWASAHVIAPTPIRKGAIDDWSAGISHIDTCSALTEFFRQQGARFSVMVVEDQLLRSGDALVSPQNFLDEDRVLSWARVADDPGQQATALISATTSDVVRAVFLGREAQVPLPLTGSRIDAQTRRQIAGSVTAFLTSIWDGEAFLLLRREP